VMAAVRVLVGSALTIATVFIVGVVFM